MTETIIIQPNSSRSSSIAPWLRYLGIGIVTNVAIWSLAIFYLLKASPTYSSKFAISLPAASSSTNVNLPGIGQTTASSDSPYQTPSQDPRENYKFLLNSRDVLKTASQQLNMTLKEFDEPRITIIANTTLMQVELSGDTPEQAQAKGKSLFDALQQKLNELRNQQVAQQDRILQETVNASQIKLKQAQKRLSDYKTSSLLNSAQQISNLTNNIEQLRRQKAEVIAQKQQANMRVIELSNNLNLSANQASDAFVLQPDPVFQKALQDYTEANAAYTTLSSRFLPAHPAVIEERAKRDAAQTLLLERSRLILGRPVNLATLAQLNVSNSTSGTSTGRASLSQQLVATEVEREGLAAQAKALEQQIMELEARQKMLAQKESTLADLERDVRTAEAVFSSTLARLDLAKSNVTAAYPEIQVFSAPSLPGSATSPKPIFVFAGAALGSLFCSNAIFLLWLRQRKQQKRKENGLISLEETGLKSDKLPEMLALTQNNPQSDKALLNGKSVRNEAGIEH